MEDLMSLVALAPVILAIVALLGALRSLTRRSKAEMEFIIELSKTLHEETLKLQKDMESLRVESETLKNEIDAYRHIYFSGVKGRAENKEYPDYLKAALLNLDKPDKIYILKALNQPSLKGRMRYFDKVLKSAFDMAASVTRTML